MGVSKGVSNIFFLFFPVLSTFAGGRKPLKIKENPEIAVVSGFSDVERVKGIEPSYSASKPLQLYGNFDGVSKALAFLEESLYLFYSFVVVILG